MFNDFELFYLPIVFIVYCKSWKVPYHTITFMKIFFPYLLICWCLLRKHKLTLTFVQNITQKICFKSTRDAFQSQLAFLICVTHAISQTCQGIIKSQRGKFNSFLLRYSGCSGKKALTFSEEKRSAWLNLKKTINFKRMLWSLYPLASGQEWHLEQTFQGIGTRPFLKHTVIMEAFN